MNDPFFLSRRLFVRRALLGMLAGVSLSAAGLGSAQGQARMDPREREQLRRALRERDGWQRANGGERRPPGRGYQAPGRAPAPGRGPGEPRHGRLSEDERRQLRRQLREQGRRRD